MTTMTIASGVKLHFRLGLLVLCLPVLVPASQLPKEADKPLIAVKAKIEMAGQTFEQPVKPGSQGVVFEIDLPAGPTELWTYLCDENGEAGGAYFTEVEAMGQ